MKWTLKESLAQVFLNNHQELRGEYDAVVRKLELAEERILDYQIEKNVFNVN